MPIAVTMDTFRSLLNEDFTVRIENVSLSAALLEVTPLSHSNESPAHQSWSLVFRFPPRHLFNQGTYEFEHPDTGRLAIFVVPIGEDEKGVRYQAIFN